MTMENVRRSSTVSFEPMPGAWAEDTYEAMDKFDTTIGNSLFTFPAPTLAETGTDKGKARMDDEYALSMFVEDALASLSEYNDDFSGVMPGGLWSHDPDILDGFKNAQTNELAKEHLTYALSSLMSQDREPLAGSSSDPLNDPWKETPTSTPSTDSRVGPPQPDLASLLLTYRELSNAGLIRAGAIPPELSREDCGVCGEKISGRTIRLECGHVYDLDCTLSMFSANVNDEQRFPPRCCGDTIPLALIIEDLAAETRTRYEAKVVEYSTPIRLYCSNRQCGTFLGAREPRASPKSCTSCGTSTCASCNEPAHDSRTRCKIDKGLKKALVLGQSRGWQRCPGCRQLVERNNGCFHMSCRCGYQFCYLCAAEWKTCSCTGGLSRLRRAFTLRRLRIRGDYLLETEYGAKQEGPLKRLWKSTVETVGRSSRR